MAADAGPVIPRRRLGTELRRLREDARFKIEDVATELECSLSKVSRLETGKGIPKLRDVRDLLELYGVSDDQQRARLLGWARQGRNPGWWSEFSDVLLADFGDRLLPRNLGRYVALEAEAGLIEIFDPHVVPVLLQTGDYARTVLDTLATTTGNRVVERLVEAQARRQQRLYSADEPLNLNVVLDEAVLYRAVGGREVMQRQLRRLLDDGERDNIDIRVLPLDAGAHPAVAGSFVLLDFPETVEHDLVYLDNHLGDVYLEKNEDVATYTQLYRSVADQALDGAASARLIAAQLTLRS